MLKTHAGAGRLIGALSAAVLSISLVSRGSIGDASGATTGNADALQARVRAELGVFTGWLAANGVRGYIGEVGWPNNADTAQWNALASKWYSDAEAAGLWTTAWATGEWWGCSYKLSVYAWSTCSTMDGTVNVARSQAAVIEARTNADNRGVNVAGGEFGTPGPLDATSSFSNANPGAYDAAYHYDQAASFTYLASRGISLVRIPLRWERIQPVLGGPLDAAELQRLESAVNRAKAAGLRVIIDIHNYGAYWLFNGSLGVRQPIGSTAVSIQYFAGLWRGLSSAFRANAGVVGYGLMNEPVGMLGGAPQWEEASQAALTAIRQNGDAKLVLVPGYNWSGAQQWTAEHPKAWISDSANNIRYEAHHYWDRDNSGVYANTYAAEVANAQARGYSASPTTTASPTTSTTKAATTTTMRDTIRPTAPASLKLSSSSGVANLAWAASTDAGGSGLAGYEVFRASTAYGPWTRVAVTTTTAYKDAAVARLSRYWYVVKAYDRAGNRSSNSNMASVVVS